MDRNAPAAQVHLPQEDKYINPPSHGEGGLTERDTSSMLPVKRNGSAVTEKKKSAFERAKERFSGRKEDKGGARIGFVIDATASRISTWEEAKTIQARMFVSVATVRSLSLRLVHFGGDLVTDHGWISDPKDVAAKMAGVSCRLGGTQILTALASFVAEEAGSRAGAIILVGDSFEEDEGEACLIASALKNAGITVFSFLEGTNPTAARVFRNLAEVTGGRFAKFGDDLPLSDLCEGVALLAAGGEKAVKNLKNEKVKRLLLTGPANK